MGQPKALLPTPPDGRPLIRRVAERLYPLVSSCIVVANDSVVCAAVASLNALCLPDAYPNTGPLGGLATGLAQIDGWSICVACDMPFVQPALFRFFQGMIHEGVPDGEDYWDAIIPYVANRPQPLHALYHARCLHSITAWLESGHYRLGDFLSDIRVRWVTEEEVRTIDLSLLSFFNANSPEEWQQAFRQMETE